MICRFRFAVVTNNRTDTHTHTQHMQAMRVGNDDKNKYRKNRKHFSRMPPRGKFYLNCHRRQNLSGPAQPIKCVKNSLFSIGCRSPFALTYTPSDESIHLPAHRERAILGIQIKRNGRQRRPRSEFRRLNSLARKL